MIEVEAVLFATLRIYHPHGESSEPFRVLLPEGSTVEDLLRQLNIPAEESKQVFINSRARELNYILQEGERVALFPPVVGG